VKPQQLHAARRQRPTAVFGLQAAPDGLEIFRSDHELEGVAAQRSRLR
jgi:hypothetical protein